MRKKYLDRSMPLHYVCEERLSSDAVPALLKACPDTAEEKNNCDFTPLQCACYKALLLKAVVALWQVCPDA
eukprot:9977042-Ditylum_brightwellii.AAC.1